MKLKSRFTVHFFCLKGLTLQYTCDLESVTFVTDAVFYVSYYVLIGTASW